MLLASSSKYQAREAFGRAHHGNLPPIEVNEAMDHPRSGKAWCRTVLVNDLA